MVYGRGGTTGRALTRHSDVRMVSFTGSVETGSKIMADAAANITKVNLELGGKAPAIVVADADLDLAAKMIKQERILNTGQVCNAPERVYMDRRVSDQLVGKLAAEMRATRYGDPLGDAPTDMGPIINRASPRSRSWSRARWARVRRPWPAARSPTSGKATITIPPCSSTAARTWT